MKVYVLSEQPFIQTLIALPSGEWLLQTCDQTRLVARDLGPVSEVLTEASESVAYVALREARGAVASAFRTALYREDVLPSLS
jgi:hypothetical protein